MLIYILSHSLQRHSLSLSLAHTHTHFSFMALRAFVLLLAKSVLWKFCIFISLIIQRHLIFFMWKLKLTHAHTHTFSLSLSLSLVLSFSHLVPYCVKHCSNKMNNRSSILVLHINKYYNYIYVLHTHSKEANVLIYVGTKMIQMPVEGRIEIVKNFFVWTLS